MCYLLDRKTDRQDELGSAIGKTGAEKCLARSHTNELRSDLHNSRTLVVLYIDYQLRKLRRTYV